jgi:hypothetical protein
MVAEASRALNKAFRSVMVEEGCFLITEIDEMSLMLGKKRWVY